MIWTFYEIVKFKIFKNRADTLYQQLTLKKPSRVAAINASLRLMQKGNQGCVISKKGIQKLSKESINSSWRY